MKPFLEATAHRAAAEPNPRAERERSAPATPLLVDRRPEASSFDLLNALLPEWPAQACSWA